jgi:PadR family transcriptional regulator PadR
MTTSEMREPTFLVLAALATGKKHGYALIAEAGQLSGGRVTLGVGTLYAVLERLGAEGLVSPAGDEVVDGRHRRYYELTDDGASALAAQIARRESTTARAKAVLAARVTARPAAGNARTSARPAAGIA